MDENERMSVVAALVVVVFSIAAFLAFIFNGSNAPFYVFALLAIVVGFYMSYRISREVRVASRTAKKGKR